MASLIIAETMQIDGGTAALILAVFLFICLVVLALVFFGYFLARSAGRGSTGALVGWLPIVGVETAVVIGAASAEFWEMTAITSAIVLSQVALFVVARSQR